jgi:CHAD domain-containing protein
MSDWKIFLQPPASAASEAENADSHLAGVLAKRAWRLSRRIVDSADDVDGQTSPERLHRLRIDAKKLRYLIDITPVFYRAADLECIVGSLKKLQRVLGDFNDASVQEKRLIECGHALGAAGGPPGALLALGRLAEQSCQRRERLRGEVHANLERFRARETRMACRRAFKRPEAEERPVR